MKLFSSLSLSLLFLFVGSFSAWADNFVVDQSHSTVGFKVPHMMISKVRGQFKDYQASFQFDPVSKKLNAISAVIQTNSIDTEHEKRDRHLRSPDFFAAEQFPVMKFTSTKVIQKGDQYEIVGDLTIKDVTKPVTLKGELIGVGKDFKGNTLAGFEAKGMISRKDFGMTWNRVMETGGIAVGDEVEMVLEIEGAKN